MLFHLRPYYILETQIEGICINKDQEWMSSQALMLLEHDLMSCAQILSQDFQEMASNIYEDASKTQLKL